MTPVAAEPVDRSIPFVDAHHHLWQLDRLRYPWLTEAGASPDTYLGDYRPIRSDWGPERMAHEHRGQNVIGTVHVEAACHPDDAVAETRWLDSVAAAYGWPNALVVACDLRLPGAPDQLRAHVEASARTRGVRARPEEPTRPAFRRALVEAARLGLSYELSRSPGRLTEGLELARLDDTLQVVVGHTGMPMHRDPAYRDLWRREMGALAAAPNVAVKISGLGMTDHRWTLESIRPWLLTTLEIFGTERCMLGTNWPVDSLYSSYAEVVDAYRRIIAGAGLTTAEQHAVLHANAERIYRFRPSPGPGPSASPADPSSRLESFPAEPRWQVGGGG